MISILRSIAKAILPPAFRRSLRALENAIGRRLMYIPALRRRFLISCMPRIHALDYAAGSGGTVRQLHPQADHFHPRPLGLPLATPLPGRRDDWGLSFEETQRRRLAPITIAHLENVRVVTHVDALGNDFYGLIGGEKVILGAGGSLIPEHLSSLLRPSSGKRLKEAAWILDIWYPNYYHWLILHLTKLVALEESGWRGPIIGPTSHWFERNGYLSASLKRLGIPMSRLLPPPETDVLIDVMPVVIADQIDGRLLAKLRNRLWNGMPTTHDRRIYIQRGETARRGLANAAAVESVLRTHGFEFVQAGRMNFDEQVALFATADCVIGLHGAGLANMLHCKPGALILEISDLDAFPNPFFYALACELGHAYAVINAAAIQNGLQLGNQDLVVDLDVLRHVLPLLLETRLARSEPNPVRAR